MTVTLAIGADATRRKVVYVPLRLSRLSASSAGIFILYGSSSLQPLLCKLVCLGRPPVAAIAERDRTLRRVSRLIIFGLLSPSATEEASCQEPAAVNHFRTIRRRPSATVRSTMRIRFFIDAEGYSLARYETHMEMHFALIVWLPISFPAISVAVLRWKPFLHARRRRDVRTTGAVRRGVPAGYAARHLRLDAPRTTFETDSWASMGGPDMSIAARPTAAAQICRRDALAAKRAATAWSGLVTSDAWEVNVREASYETTPARDACTRDQLRRAVCAEAESAMR